MSEQHDDRVRQIYNEIDGSFAGVARYLASLEARIGFALLGNVQTNTDPTQPADTPDPAPEAPAAPANGDADPPASGD